MRLRHRVAVVAVAAGAAVGGAAWPALAGSDATAYYSNPYGQQAAHVHFYAYGEHFATCDDLQDGYSAAVEFYRPDGTHVVNFNDGGVGTCKDTNWGFPEGRSIQFRACIGRASDHVLVACGPWAYGVS